jgi:hypothetical protein
MGQPVPPVEPGPEDPEPGEPDPCDPEDPDPDGVEPGEPVELEDCPLPGTIPTLTLLFAALHDTPPASPGFTATCTSSAFPLLALDAFPMDITTAFVVSMLLDGLGQRPVESLVAKISMCSPT